MTDFRVGEPVWIQRLSNLRNAIRQELVRRQLAAHLPSAGRALDVGCGQGTQALHLLAKGFDVTGVDPSLELLELFESEAERRHLRPFLLHGDLDAVADLVEQQRFEVVCAHGLLMYLPDTAAAVTHLTDRVADGGVCSFTFRNGHALAYRHGLRRDWSGALAAFETASYVNELGVAATAHRLEDIEAALATAGFGIDRWYGIRVFNDGVAGDVDVPDDEDWDALIDAEFQAGCLDPYRWLGSQIHVIASRQDPPDSG